MVRTAQLARVLVLDIGIGTKGIMRAAHATTRRASFAFWNGHEPEAFTQIGAAPKAAQKRRTRLMVEAEAKSKMGG